MGKLKKLTENDKVYLEKGDVFPTKEELKKYAKCVHCGYLFKNPLADMCGKCFEEA